MYGFHNSSTKGYRSQPHVIDVKYGDVTGNSVFDAVYLTGEKPDDPKSPFVTEISLYIQEGRTDMWSKVVPKENAGVQPTISLADFTDNGVNEVLLSIFSGGSGGYAFYYLYSLINNTPLIIFDFEKFNKEITYTVTFQNNYQVEVAGNNNSKYTIDLRYKGKDYLSEIYDSDGKLKEEIKGWVNPLGDLYPLDFQRNGVNGLFAIQRIAGRYNADVIGYVQTSLEWDGSRFKPFFQTVAILG